MPLHCEALELMHSMNKIKINLSKNDGFRRLPIRISSLHCKRAVFNVPGAVQRFSASEGDIFCPLRMQKYIFAHLYISFRYIVHRVWKILKETTDSVVEHSWKNEILFVLKDLLFYCVVGRVKFTFNSWNTTKIWFKIGSNPPIGHWNKGSRAAVTFPRFEKFVHIAVFEFKKHWRR